MKKRISAILLTVLAFTMTACGGTDEIGEASPQVQNAQDIVAESTVSGEETEGQNPVMNVVGPYAAGDMVMQVNAVGKDSAEITVTQTTAETGSSTWHMSGVFNTDTLTVEYTDCVRRDRASAEPGSEETVVYEDGTGRIIFGGLDGTCFWEDDKDHVADELMFEFSFPYSDTAGDSSLSE